jgi:asparagine synthase (glutamine-hydrolysing)
MPGIVGLLTKMPRERAESQLLRMVEVCRHENSYRTGTWTDAALGVYVGWIARKDSFAAAMPLRNERDNVVLAFSGEEYPDPGTASRLRARGHRVEPQGPSYLVHLYEDDPAFPASLNGRFHGLLADRARGVAMLFNDRYGMHRLYYHEADDAFYFAAEAKAILAVRRELRTPDARALGEFVACGCVMENRTIFKGLRLLPAGAAWMFRDASIERRATYFQPAEWEQQDLLDPESYYRALRETFAQNLPRYFGGHERIGMSLTGGLDTRLIMAWRKPAPASLPCYTFGGMFRESHDVAVARRVAATCGQSHEVITVGDEFLSRFPSYAERSMYLTEGTVDMSRSPDLFVSERARDIAPAKIVGTYASEILCRLPMFKPREPVAGLFRPELMSYVRQARDTYTELRREHPVTFAAFRQSPWYHHGVLALEQSQLTVRSPYLDNEFVRTAFRAPTSAAADGDVRVRLIADGDPALAGIPTDRGIGVDADGLAAAVSRRLLEFTFKAEYAYDYGMPQWLARMDHLFSPLHLERVFLGRHKLFHFRVWYRDALSAYLREMLLDPRTLGRPYLERTALEAVVRGHLNGDRNYTVEIHRVLALELLHRLFLDAS